MTQGAVPPGKVVRRIHFNSSQRPPGYSVKDCLSLSPNNRLLAIGGFNEVNTVAVLSLESGKVLGTFVCCPPSIFCSKVYFSPDGRTPVTDTERVNQKDELVKPLLKFWKIPDEWFDHARLRPDIR